MKSAEIDLEREAKKLDAALARAIEATGDHHAQSSNLTAVEISGLKGLAQSIIAGLHVNILLNAAANELPPHVLFCVVIEAIGEWNKEIDRLAGKPDHGQN